MHSNRIFWMKFSPCTLKRGSVCTTRDVVDPFKHAEKLTNNGMYQKQHSTLALMQRKTSHIGETGVHFG